MRLFKYRQLRFALLICLIVFLIYLYSKNNSNQPVYEKKCDLVAAKYIIESLVSVFKCLNSPYMGGFDFKYF